MDSRYAYPKCDNCHSNKWVSCLFKYYEWHCSKCKSSWYGSA